MSTSYKTHFLKAVENTVAAGLTVPTVPSLLGARITEAQGFSLMGRLAEFDEGTIDPLQFVLQCAHRTHDLRRMVEEEIGMSCVPTIGDVRNNDSPIWGFALDRFEESVRAGRFHVWLTASNGEIIDLTFVATKQFQAGRSLDNAGPIAGMPDELSPQLKWVPSLVGDDALAWLFSVAGFLVRS